jgi:hypothetical protein
MIRGVVSSSATTPSSGAFCRWSTSLNIRADTFAPSTEGDRLAGCTGTPMEIAHCSVTGSCATLDTADRPV